MKNIPISKPFFLVILTALASILLIGPANAQYGRSIQISGNYEQKVNTTINEIYTNYIIPGKLLDGAATKKYKQLLKDIGNGNTDEAKANIYILRALLTSIGSPRKNDTPEDVQSRKRKVMLGHIRSALLKCKKLNSPPKTVLDSAFYLTLQLEDYQRAKDILKFQNAGHEAIQEYKKSNKTWGSSIDSSVDPNSLGVTPSNREADPNSPGADPNSLGVKKRPTTNKKKAPRQYSNQRGNSSNTKSPLNLLTNYMPYEKIGSDFGPLQMLTINGSIYQYNPSQGKILCALIWSLPQKGKTNNRTKQSGYGYMGNRQYNNNTTKTKKPFDQASSNLKDNIKAFTKLFSQYIANGLAGPTGAIDFVGINCNGVNPVTQKEIAKFITGNPCPWAHCMIDTKLNSKHLKQLPLASPVMVIVGTDGKVRYVGPVDGMLPYIILKKQIAGANPKTSSDPLAAIGKIDLDAILKANNVSTDGKAEDMLKSLLGKADKISKNNDSNAIKTNTVIIQPQTPPTKTTTPPVAKKKSNHQAFMMYQTAYNQKKIGSFGSALSTCDTIMERWPNCSEVDKAKALIKRICQVRSIYARERKKAGKYTGLD